ncbi:deoxynucleoside kinase [candidate division WOR-3 bacterium]|uniref:Deoxynucleoside kinase n=1 Tax=candidate division WOR-3 bacterium TaxID=2052148 RepID=A0A938BTC5_UNCW3|nr:deoxynucleoside kinase [candidate division WOR-3 bacterium]
MRYLCIEGPIGVGKTALADLLAKRLDARLVKEAVEENPFLEKFYGDMRNYALPTQLFFLLSRHKQQSELLQSELFKRTVVCDYLFDKDRVFAHLNLTEHELTLYDRIYTFVAQEIPKPSIVVYLQARVEVLLARIRQRARGFEAAIDPEYLAELADAYNHYFMHYEAAPVLIVNTERLDFVANREDFEDLFRAIEETTTGRRFYSPRGKGR